MMSQNRADTKDRIRAELAYRVNVKAETESGDLHTNLEEWRGELMHAIDRAARHNTSTDSS
jgi:uncharacterized membrane protein